MQQNGEYRVESVTTVFLLSVYFRVQNKKWLRGSIVSYIYDVLSTHNDFERNVILVLSNRFQSYNWCSIGRVTKGSN